MLDRVLELIAAFAATIVLLDYVETLTLGPVSLLEGLVHIIPCSYIAIFCFVEVVRGMDDSISSATAIAVRGYRAYLFQYASIILNLSFIARLLNGKGICPQAFLSFGGVIELVLHSCFMLQGIFSGGTIIKIHALDQLAANKPLVAIFFQKMRTYHGIFALSGLILTWIFNIIWLRSCAPNHSSDGFDSTEFAVKLISAISFFSLCLFGWFQMELNNLIRKRHCNTAAPARFVGHRRMAGQVMAGHRAPRVRSTIGWLKRFDPTTHNQMSRSFNRLSFFVESLAFFGPIVLRYYLWYCI